MISQATQRIAIEKNMKAQEIADRKAEAAAKAKIQAEIQAALVKAAAEAGCDAILFDGGKLTFEENMRETQEAVRIAKSVNPNILVEGELGYIGGSS